MLRNNAVGKFVRSLRISMDPFIRTHSFQPGSPQHSSQENTELGLPEQVRMKAVGSESSVDCELQV